MSGKIEGDKMSYQQGRDPRVTNEACWKGGKDNLLPNPPYDAESDKDEEIEGPVKKAKNDVKVIMAHEFRENPEGLRSIAEAIVDSYNEQHSITVEIGKEEEK